MENIPESQVLIQEVTASGADIDRVIDKIALATVDEDPKNIIIACLAAAFFIQYPEIQAETIVTGIKEVGAFMSNYLKITLEPPASKAIN